MEPSQKKLIHLTSALGLLVTLGSLTSIAFAKLLEDLDWIAVTTTNFEIRSLRPEADTILLARHLESARAAIPRVIDIPQSDSALPLQQAE